jgi:hypothetical protein
MSSPIEMLHISEEKYHARSRDLKLFSNQFEPRGLKTLNEAGTLSNTSVMSSSCLGIARQEFGQTRFASKADI